MCYYYESTFLCPFFTVLSFSIFLMTQHTTASDERVLSQAIKNIIKIIGAKIPKCAIRTISHIAMITLTLDSQVIFNGTKDRGFFMWAAKLFITQSVIQKNSCTRTWIHTYLH